MGGVPVQYSIAFQKYTVQLPIICIHYSYGGIVWVFGCAAAGGRFLTRGLLGTGGGSKLLRGVPANLLTGTLPTLNLVEYGFG